MKINIKELLVVLVFIILIGFVAMRFQSCSAPKNGSTIVSPLKVETPTTDDNKYIPNGDKAIGVIKPKNIITPRWESRDTKIIESVDSKCDTCAAHFTEVDTIKTYIGFPFEPRLLLGYDTNGLTLAFDEGIFRYGKYTADAFVGFPMAGLGLGYSITSNFGVLVGADVPFLLYTDVSKPSTYSFPLGLTVRPIAGLLWNF